MGTQTCMIKKLFRGGGSTGDLEPHMSQGSICKVGLLTILSYQVGMAAESFGSRRSTEMASGIHRICIFIE